MGHLIYRIKHENRAKLSPDENNREKSTAESARKKIRQYISPETVPLVYQWTICYKPYPCYADRSFVVLP